MEPEDQKPKITLANFFESIKDTNVVAQRALKLSSGLSKTVEKTAGTVEVSKKDIQELQKTVSTISKDVTNIQDYIEEQQERRSRELDKREDEIFEKEDKLQKESKGDQGPLGRAKDFLDNRVDGGSAAIASAGLGPSLLGLNALALSDRNFSEMVSGITDKLTGNLFDLDRRNPNEKNPLLGGLDLLSFDILDLDKKGRVIPGVKQFMNFYEGTDMGKKEAEILGGVENFFDKAMTSYNEQNIGKAGLFGPLGILTKMYGDLFRKKDKSEKMNKGGSVPGSGNTDSVFAMLTPGEYVIKKESADKLGENLLTSLNESGDKKENPVVKSLKNFFNEGKESKTSLKNLTNEDYYYLGLAVSGEARLNSDDVYGVVASILNRVASNQYKNTVKDVVLSRDTADGKMEYEALNIMDINHPKISKEVKNFLQGDKRNIIKDLKSEKGQKGIIEALQILDGRTNYKGQDQIKNRVEAEDPMFDKKGNFFHYNFQETPSRLAAATEEEKNYRPPTTEKFVETEDPKPEGLKRVLAGAADAVTGNKFDFDQRGVNPDMSDSNKDLSVNIAQNPSEGGGDIEVMEAITQQSGESSGDGLGNSMPPPFDIASTGKPMIMNPESTSDFIDLISSKSNNAFV